MSIRDDVASLEQQLADIAVGDAAGVLARLAEAVFPGGISMGDPARILWPEPGRVHGPGRRVGQPDELEAQIRQSEARFRSLVEQLPAVVFYAALGDEENEAYVSPQIESLLGFTQQEWLTNPLLWYSQLHPGDHQAVIEAFTRGVQTGSPFRAEVRFFSRTGEEVWILGEARLIRDERQRPAYFQGVAFDITMIKRAQESMAAAERARAEAAQLRAEAYATHNVQLRELNQELRLATEAAEAAARARSTFLTTMSHELRTPLNSVIVLAGLLADEELSPRQRDMLRRMQLASDHLLELINDVLEFSRLRAGQVQLHLRTFDLFAWVDDTMDIVAPRAAEKGLVLRRSVGAGVPRTLSADEGRLRQVLLNLLGNAVKFTASGTVEVRVAAVALGEGRWEFECAVRDTGIGIDPDGAATLFDEFRQADSGIAREFGGTGLGLAICKRLCELLGGRIWVESPPGGPAAAGDSGGATIAFTWIAEADAGSVAATCSCAVLAAPLPSVAVPAVPVAGSVAAAAGPGAAGPVAAGAAAAVAAGSVAAVAAGSVAPVAAPGAAVAGPGAAVSTGAVGGSGNRRHPERSTLRILVAEDNLMNQQVALLLLAAMGYEASVVGNGDEAIAAVRAAPYDVVLMDIAMPGTDGLSATRAIRSLGASLYQPYIVALTAHAFPGDADACMAAGMDDYVAKPIDRSRLAQALDAGAAHASLSAASDGAKGGADGGTPPPAGASPRPERLAGGDFDPTLAQSILADFGPEPLGRLVALFRSEATRLVATAAVAIADGRIPDVEIAAHSLKSSAANLGASGLYDTCARLETLTRSGSLDGAEALSTTMHRQLADALGRLDDIASSVAGG